MDRQRPDTSAAHAAYHDDPEGVGDMTDGQLADHVADFEY